MYIMGPSAVDQPRQQYRLGHTRGGGCSWRHSLCNVTVIVLLLAGVAGGGGRAGYDRDESQLIVLSAGNTQLVVRGHQNRRILAAMRRSTKISFCCCSLVGVNIDPQTA